MSSPPEAAQPPTPWRSDAAHAGLSLGKALLVVPVCVPVGMVIGAVVTGGHPLGWAIGSFLGLVFSPVVVALLLGGQLARRHPGAGPIMVGLGIAVAGPALLVPHHTWLLALVFLAVFPVTIALVRLPPGSRQVLERLVAAVMVFPLLVLADSWWARTLG